ncbi:type IV pilin [Natronorubrum sp. FCH18a]|uniref:type IV pilin n=1 Tax=Natronorubrum sp. FCH18a TaxID=3447018 RepID=UPI003F50EA8A
MSRRPSGPSISDRNCHHRSGCRGTDCSNWTRSGFSGRAVSRLVGVLALLAVTVLLATIVAVGASTWSLESGGPTAAFDLAVDGEEARVVLDHLEGDAIDVTELSMRITVNGGELANQPPVPFVGAEGFDGSPTGPFNSKSDSEWRTGERAGVTVADTNDPTIESGDAVAVTLVVDGSRVATLETTAT